VPTAGDLRGSIQPPLPQEIIMKLTCVSLVSAGLVIASFTGPIKAADNASSVVGTWRITSWSVLTLETNEVSYPVGENPIGYIQYSSGGHMVVFLQKGNPPQPPGQIYPDAYRAQVHKDLFAAYAGTYSVEGNKVTHHIVASSLPHQIGSDQVRYTEINGNKLTIKTAPAIFTQTGKQIVSTLAFERVE
jgi:hypothetical protein